LRTAKDPLGGKHDGKQDVKYYYTAIVTTATTTTTSNNSSKMGAANFEE